MALEKIRGRRINAGELAVVVGAGRSGIAAARLLRRAGARVRLLDSNIKALRALSHKLTPENLALLERFAKAREMSLVPRLLNLKRSGIYRQTFLGNLGLIAAAIFRKL